MGDIASSVMRGEKDKQKLHGKKSKVDKGLDRLLDRLTRKSERGRKAVGADCVGPDRTYGTAYDRTRTVKSIRAKAMRLVDVAADAQDESGVPVATQLQDDVGQLLFDTGVGMALDAVQEPTSGAADPARAFNPRPNRGQDKKKLAADFTFVANVSDALTPVGGLATTVLEGSTDASALTAMKTQAEEGLDELLAIMPGGSPYARGAESELRATVRAVKANVAELVDAALRSDQGGSSATTEAAVGLNGDLDHPGPETRSCSTSPQ
ncbi:hypothetical protein ACFWZ2_13475 [Streptomyces sp. NPDC059002]|uniref:hypothetical protein n=1 Tax=Streptomyces sp. NPDC059002 TaxID=3346690 RepID=UPI003682BBBF